MMADSSGSSIDSLREGINEIAPAGVFLNKVGRLYAAMEKKKGDDVVDGLTHPSKGRKVKRVGIEDLKSCDQIYVGAYIFKDLGKAEKKEKKGHRRTAGHLWQHHLLIGRVQNHDNELVLTKIFYEFTGEYTYASGITSGLTRAMKNADTRKYLVTATKSRECASKWSINNKDFRNYTKRGLNRYEHDEYGDDEAYIDLVIRRAEATCKASLKGKYDMLHYYCEHIVTACKGLCNGYGYCFQFKTFGKDQIPQPLPPHSVPAEGYDSAETVTLAGDIQATDDADDDKDEDSKLMIDHEFEDDCYSESPHEDKVPHNVTEAISELYRELKANDTIINDLLHTAKPIIPNIFHFVRINQSHLEFAEMLAILSAIEVGNALKVLIHTNTHLEGKYWDMLRYDKRIRVIHRDMPTTIFGKSIGWVQHTSDLVRIQVLREYGGIYLDNDCLAVNDITSLRRHHCVVAKPADEDFIGNQLLMGTEDCVFLRMYEELYRLHYDRAQWYFNGGHLPAYALLDKYPGIAYPTDEGVHQGMMGVLWDDNWTVEDIQKNWRVIHLFYRHKDYTYNDTTQYNLKNIKTKQNTFTNLARWLVDE